MTYVFQFGPVFARWPELLAGTLLTIELSLISMGIGLVVAVLLAALRTFGPAPARWLIAAYVELIRNTPFLIQLYFVFFALPGMGLRLSAGAAAVTAMVINLAAYAVEILRAGLEAVPVGQIEAGRALGLSPYRIVRHVILAQAVRTVYPAMASQFILVLLGSSIVSAIAAEELTAVGNNIMIQTFRSFEVFGVITAIYLALSLGFRALFCSVHHALFRWVG
jgi:polar amino acid transport system permease protein